MSEQPRGQLRRRPLGRQRRLMLALQGGGSHGAFTWGVLERLLDEPRLDIRALSGTSAGALNAATLAAGWVSGGRRGAAESLSAFWAAISRASAGGRAAAALGLLDGVWGGNGDANARLLEKMPGLGSPYQLTPPGFHPLRALLDETMDIEALRHGDAPRLLVAATNVHSGRARVFTNAEVDVDVLLASSCLPSFFRAVAIDGEYYWDGGYALNPPIVPLMNSRRARDLVLVQLSPTWREAVPTDRQGIEDRARELAFNAGQVRELEVLASLPRWFRGLLPRLHHVGGDGHLDVLDRHAPLNTDWHFLNGLRRAGHERADDWLRVHGAAVGRHSTLDLGAYATGHRPRG